MARTKRKVNPVVPVAVVTEETVSKAYRTAAYIRLSIEDSGKPGSDTLDSQRKFVTEFVESQSDMVLTKVYCDNGHTGTNFDRPQFDLLMEAVRRGEINCIAVKDLSRFGRNYKETGNYLERIFPFLGIRFIAINDNFDTLTAERNEFGFIIPLKNLMNETYSRDISKKIATALEAKERRGEFIGVYAPYGYSKSPEDRHKLVINPETAPVVKRIFSLRLTGLGYARIAKMLNAERVLSPGAYLYHSKISTRESYRDAIWAAWNIKEILKSEVYLGHLVQGKRTNEGYKQLRKDRFAPESEWRITRNAHEAIIDEDTFRACQKMAEHSKKNFDAMLGNIPAEKTENIFLGRIFCANCGKAMPRVQIYSNYHGGKRYYYSFRCPTNSNKRSGCLTKSIPEDKLIQCVEDSVRCYTDAVTELEKRIQKIQEQESVAQKRETAAEIAAAQREINRCRSLHDGLYQNLVEGIISRQEYVAMKERYQALLDESEASLEALQAQQKEDKRFTQSNPLFSLKQELQPGQLLSAELISSLISRIDVGENKQVHITFSYMDEFEALSEYAKEAEVV